MSTEEIKSSIDAMGVAFEEFKKTNDEKLAQIESKGSADPITEEKLAKINDAMDAAQSRMDKLETASKADTSKEMEVKGNAATLAYKNAYLSFARKGENNLTEMEKKSLSVNIDPDGGFLVTPMMSSTISKAVFESTPMRQLASVETISTDSLDVILDGEQASAGWTAEKGTVSETGTPQIQKDNIPTHELYAEPRATQKILDDAAIDVEAWLAGKIAEKFANFEATAFTTGNGVGQPKGILSYTAGTTWGSTIEQISSASSTGGTILGNDITNLIYGIKSEYASGASFLMNRATVKAVRQLADTTGQYLWQPSLQAGEPSLLGGFPVFEGSDMPVLATDSLSIAFGNFKTAYKIVDRIGIRTLRDPYTSKPFIKFYTTKRVGGAVINTEAIKLLKMDA